MRTALVPGGWLVLGPSDPRPGLLADFEMHAGEGAVVYRRVELDHPRGDLFGEKGLKASTIRLKVADQRPTANPLGAIASAALLLRHTARLEREAQDVESAVRGVLEAGYRTADLRGGAGSRTIGTAEMGALVSDAVAELADMRHAYHAV